jgi:hypothetical protein
VIQRSAFRLCLPLFLGCLALCFGARGQVANNTSLVGTVTDESGTVVAGAKVRAVNTGTGAAYPVTTNEDGYYSIDLILAGTYEVLVDLNCFVLLLIL